MAKDKMYGKTLRKNFARHEEIMEMPNLLELQKKSYRWFLDEGLQEVFTDVASITNYAGNLELSFIGYKMDEAPKYDVEECKARDATYAAPLKVNVRLYNNQTQEIKEQEIFMGDFPLMTQSGTFVINGAERVVVSQIVRSPGVYYGKEIDLKTDLPLLTSTVIPYRGAWLEYETDTNEVFWVRIDKNRKIPITELIRAIGGQAEQYADLKTSSATTTASRSRWRRTPARPMRRPCWRSTASSVRASRPRSRPARASSRTSSSIRAAMICPWSAATSSIRSSPCGPASTARSSPIPSPTRARARSSLTPAMS